MREIITLEQLRPSDQALFGGKAVHLSTLIHAGMDVPPGFCVSAASFRSFIEANELLPRITDMLTEAQAHPEGEAACLERLRSVIVQAPHQPGFLEALSVAYARLSAGSGRAVVAVRSSARSEDSADVSFAGQYDSVLDVQGFDALCAAIKQGWASYFSDRAVRYRRQCRQVKFAFDMGLVVQKMIDPEVAGVMFTLNPVSGSRREMLIEAGFGLGEAFVSGQLCPDRYYLARPTLPWMPARLTIQQRRVEPKTQMLRSTVPGSGRLTLVDIPPQRRNQPALTDQQAIALCRTGLRIERLFRAPQDIEWAIDADGRVFVLQARPITGLISRRYQRRNSILWTQRFSGERWTEPATTLGWSIIQPILHHFIYFEDIGRKYLDGSLPTRVINSYPYFNITIFRHLVWKLPGLQPPQFILEFFPKEEQDEILAAPYIIPNLALVRDIFAQVWRERRWRRYHWNFLTNYRAWDTVLPTFLEAIEALPEQTDSAAEARAAVRTGQYWIQEYVKIHLLSLLFANLYYQLLAGLLRRWAGHADEQRLSSLVAEPDNNKTVETNHALWRLADLARTFPQLQQRLETEPLPTAEELRILAGGQEFAAALKQFLRQYGHRSSASWEIFSPRWCDDPSDILQVIRTYLDGGQGVDPIEVAARRSRGRRVAEAEVLRSIGRWHPWRRIMLGHVLHSTQRYMTLRENQRFYFDKLLLRIKRNLEHLGKRWTREGYLARPEDLTLLTLDEIDEVLAGQLEAPALALLINERREAYARDLAANHPVFIEGDRYLSPEPPVAGRTLSGLGISPGRITGPVRVIHQLNEIGKLRRGDILVTRATDPGWTPLFLTAGGLITELGSLLSHGAVVAREYNLPAVVNITHATSLLKDGQEITLDGSRGVVYLR